jgi:spermidine synthase
MDALAYIHTTQNSYDLIIVDIFDNEVLPTPFVSKEFYMKASKLLNPNGILTQNIKMDTDHSVIDFTDYLLLNLNNNFNQVIYVFVCQLFLFCNSIPMLTANQNGPWPNAKTQAENYEKYKELWEKLGENDVATHPIRVFRALRRASGLSNEL